MSEQHGRKGDPWKLPGEGTGVYGVDPLVFLKPGDNAEVDKLLEELRTDCDEGDPFFVDFRKRKGTLKAPANRQGGEGGAKEGRGKATRRGVSPRWLGYATVAIVGPAVTLSLVLVLSSREAVIPEGAREPASATASDAASDAARVEERIASGRAPESAAPSEAVAAPSESALMPLAAAPAKDAVSSAAAGARAVSGRRAGLVRPRGTQEEEDPYEMPSVAASTGSPSGSPPPSSPASPEPSVSAKPGSIPEMPVPKGAMAVENAEAEF